MPKPLRIVPQPQPEAGQEPASLARRALDAALSDLREAERLGRAAREPIARLEAEIGAELPAAAALQALEAADAAAIAEWARTGDGPAPEPRIRERQEAAATLALAQMRASAAGVALAAARATAAEADGRCASARDRLKPAVGRVLREDGARLAADYWRRYAELDHVRRALIALDRVLNDDFPVIHEATGRPIIAFLSPDKLSAPEAMRAIDQACAGLASVETFTRDWRTKAAGLTGEPSGL